MEAYQTKCSLSVMGKFENRLQMYIERRRMACLVASTTPLPNQEPELRSPYTVRLGSYPTNSP